ncbi:ABC transporter substrate-binding protein [Microvirga tunisiensis]|uniref:ABC transporter substrate-binding protein n=2 Tax=Pannonibacter tanglangensis TaxID=2750084 RepID=A0A7X5F3K9_9HYPH|nr:MULTISPECIES: ABC transporter substrate-binding protein [unclassified Pannonibacter]NBN64608.1 ABC transporter substrate-binding protein [Pannonibacter sp. XCT-34]NBN79143.1 ABC transporter substrate-binding protein [Pannonibacter sp. XCT-53]
MNKKVLALAGSLLAATTLAGTSAQADVKIGLLGGITGPIAAMAPAMLLSAEMAITEVNAQGGIGKGEKLVQVTGDDACNPQNGTDAATKAVNIDGVVGLVGPHCSGAVIAAANSVTIPAGIALITPSGTSPEITKLKDNDTVFRTVPSDDYQGRALARALKGKGMDSVAVAYLNNDYGTGLANAFKAEYESIGGKITAFAAHEGEKASYRTNLAELAKGGSDTLVIFDYGDGSGLTMLRESLENGFFKNFVGADGMKSDAPIKELGASNLNTFFTSAPVGEKSDSLEIFAKNFKDIGGDPDAVFVTTSYDATFLMAMAIEKAGGDKTKVAKALREITATTDGEPVKPGEWAKAKELIAAGKPITYKGAAGDYTFDANGDVPGVYALFKVGAAGFEKMADMK